MAQTKPCVSHPSFQCHWAPNPSTERGDNFHLGAHPKESKIIYPSGKFVVVRDVVDPTNVFVYRGHNSKTTVAKFSPNGFWVASGDITGKVGCYRGRGGRVWFVEGGWGWVYIHVEVARHGLLVAPPSGRFVCLLLCAEEADFVELVACATCCWYPVMMRTWYEIVVVVRASCIWHVAYSTWHLVYATCLFLVFDGSGNSLAVLGAWLVGPCLGFPTVITGCIIPGTWYNLEHI